MVVMTGRDEESRIFAELYPSLRRFAAVVLAVCAVAAGGSSSESTTESTPFRAIPSGGAHYVGEGAYEGLEFHYHFFHAISTPRPSRADRSSTGVSPNTEVNHHEA
jgi:hypothetical protein